MTADITTRAQAFADSYVAAVTLANSNPSATTSEIAKAIVSHYHTTDFAAYSWGHIAKLGKPEESLPNLHRYLETWIDSGIGLNYFHEKTRIEVVSSSSALCFMTWGVKPKNNVEPWTWENVYAFRLPPGSEQGYWEFTISDNEAAEAVKRIPNIFDAMV